MMIPHKLTQNYLETAIDDEILIVDLDGGELFSLKGTACETWLMIDGKRSEDDLIKELSSRFEAPREQISKDLRIFMEALEHSALIKFL